jgi:hypothetical protein
VLEEENWWNSSLELFQENRSEKLMQRRSDVHNWRGRMKEEAEEECMRKRKQKKNVCEEESGEFMRRRKWRKNVWEE